MTRHTRARAAFTLIEMIVVIGIIALLMTLTAAAVMRMRESSRESNTNVHLNKIHMELQKQWNAQVALIKNEPIPQAIIELTKDQYGTEDRARARALHTKLRLRQEFPQNFSELVPSPPLTINGQTYIYPVKAAFKTALKSPLAAETTPEAQSAALLYLILSQGSGGSTTDVDSIARTKLMDYPQQNNAPAIQLKVFADEWSNHIGFRRWADDDMTDVVGTRDVPGELNLPPFVAAPAPPLPGISKNDPQDPEGRLQLAAQPPWNPNLRQQALTLLATPKLQNPFDGLNRGPFVFSAGKNGLFRINNDPAQPFETNLDNLYSYRIAGSGKGN
jgi:prepilin-type N-terminal cleavage/methylation domain-containing protein